MYRVNQAWLYGNVKPYFESQGIKLLRDDMLFIEKCLGNVPPEFHRRVIRDYFSAWNTNGRQDDESSKKAVNMRFKANSYLRSISGVKNEN